SSYSRTRPSTASSSVSMATSLFLALKLGPSSLVGHPSRKVQRSASLRPSSSRTIEPPRRSVAPSMTVLRHSHSELSCVQPRFNEMLVNFFRPGSLRTVMSSSPLRYSMTSVSVVSPLHSEKPATSIPSISSRKLKALYGSFRSPLPAMFHCSFRLGFRSLLAEAEDDEFSGFGGGHSDVADQAAIVDVVLRHGGAVALDEKGFFFGSAHQ